MRLDPDIAYDVRALAPGADPGCPTDPVTGAHLMADGLTLTGDGDAQSWLLIMTPSVL